MHNPDPKPWRWWVLPVAFLGMVLLAWVWISGQDPPAVDDAQPISTTSVTTRSTTASGDTENAAADTEAEETTTTTTTLSVPYIDVYLENLGDDKKALAEVVAEIVAVEGEWGVREINYRETEERLVAVTERAVAFSNSVASNRPPDSIPGLADAHQMISGAADTVAKAAETLLAVVTRSGIDPPMVSPVVMLRVAAESFCEQVEQIREIALQG